MNIKLLNGDCLEQMKQLPDNSVDSIVTDPPYGISFMAKKWDYDVPSVDVWKEAMRVLKPGGHALIACGTRTQHRMVVNIEDAGFEIRDVVSWIYGSGFPKSLNISKAIDKAAGAEREVVGVSKGAASQNTESLGKFAPEYDATAPATEAAKQWDGWGTALKPSCEFFTLCRKPLSEKTVAANVLKWGTGGINIDGCRVETSEKLVRPEVQRFDNQAYGKGLGAGTQDEPQGRFPANLIHDGSQQVLELFPETNKASAARFFYCPKASKKDRDEGNHHPTVKPTALMQYLCRLITPTGGVVLDPYMGSGSTGKAAVREGFSFVGCELDKDYYEIAKARINYEN
jgi:DNA modification methylase